MTSRFKTLFTPILGAVAALSLGTFAGPQANAHTISVGTYNAGTLGSVTVVLGSYHSSGSPEGSIQLTAGPSGPSSVISFTDLVTVKSGELIDGTNNFFASASAGSDPSSTFDALTGVPGRTTLRWQSVTFTGLTAGDYTYQISGMNSDIWNDWNSLTANWQGQLTITGEAVVGVLPEPGTLAVLGLGLAGIGFARRRRAA
ncbi:MAG: hypothetical protein ACI9JL_004203 [Paracoccaceae bacterium]|jgi:hypothetical protein